MSTKNVAHDTFSISLSLSQSSHLAEISIIAWMGLQFEFPEPWNLIFHLFFSIIIYSFWWKFWVFQWATPFKFTHRAESAQIRGYNLAWPGPARQSPEGQNFTNMMQRIIYGSYINRSSLWQFYHAHFNSHVNYFNSNLTSCARLQAKWTP